MAVRIRLKKMGRKARPFYRLCAVDSRAPRDGKVIEELGTYDPMVRETDARVTMKTERVDYWIGVGAQPSQKAGVLIRKYGTSGSHLEQQKEAVERMKTRPIPVEPTQAPKVKPEAKAEAEEPKTEEAASEEATEEKKEEPTAEAAESKEDGGDKK